MKYGTHRLVSVSYHDGFKSEDLVVILQHLDEVFLGRLWDEGQARLERVLVRTKAVVRWQRLHDKICITLQLCLRAET